MLEYLTCFITVQGFPQKKNCSITSKSKLSNIDFYVFDSNDNYHYEVNEKLEDVYKRQH